MGGGEEGDKIDNHFHMLGVEVYKGRSRWGWLKTKTTEIQVIWLTYN